MDGSRERDVICLWGEKKDLVVLVGFFSGGLFVLLNSERHGAASLYNILR